MKDRAVFLDRGGTIAGDAHCCRRVKGSAVLPTIPEASKLLDASGLGMVVIANQLA